jgi:dCMP deaminase
MSQPQAFITSPTKTWCASITPSQKKWDVWFLGLAKYISTASKDPSTKCGAVIVDENRRIVSTGYNGFPRNVSDAKEDYDNRELKYEKVVHCEVNAIIFAQRDLTGCTLYTMPFGSCSRCAAVVIQAGIKRVVSPILPVANERWTDNLKIAQKMFHEANVEIVTYNGDL